MNEPLKNARWERFAVLVAAGVVSLSQAYVEAGYSPTNADAGGSALAVKPQIASRIDFFRKRHEANTAIKCDISRERIVQELARIALNASSDLVRIRAIDTLNKMQGYNEPELRNVQHVHLQLDHALAEQLRAGAHELVSARSRLHSGCAQAIEAQAVDGAPVGSRVPPPPSIEHAAPTPAPFAKAEIIIPSPLPEYKLPDTSPA